ncbi:MAG TPA: DUF1206 domain-containing protein [Steroidobacteraceae bacterium]|nr:DUF1206 domain-containing protein [Steroidobacteraceae bacterium]
MAHAGYLAEGVLYLLIGAFALLAALDVRRHPNGTRGIMVTLSFNPAGEILLGAVGIGLTAYVLWQLLVAIQDPEHRHERDRPYRRMVRAGHLLNGALHSVIVLEALRILFGLGAEESGREAQTKWIARALGAPLGRYVVGAVGIGIVLYGLYQCYRAVTRHKDSRVDLTRTRLRPLIDVLGVYGLLARGVMFVLIGIYLIDAAWRLDARYSVGVAGALATLRQQPYGAWFLGAVAAGLTAYGLCQIAKEPFRLLRDS